METKMLLHIFVILTMACANNNWIKSQMTAAVSVWFLFQNVAFSPHTMNHKNILESNGPQTKQNCPFRLLATGCANSSKQLAVAVSGWIHFILFYFKISQILHCKLCNILETHFFANIDNLNFLSGRSCSTFQYGHNAIVFCRKPGEVKKSNSGNTECLFWHVGFLIPTLLTWRVTVQSRGTVGWRGRPVQLYFPALSSWFWN